MVRRSDDFKFRSRFVAFCFLLFGGLLGGRLFFIQVANHDFFITQAERQYNSYLSKPSISIRGSIYFKEKDGQLISAAAIKDGFLAAVNPAAVTNAEEACLKIKQIIALDEETCIKRAQKTDDPFEEIVHRLNFSQAEEIKNLKIEGVNVYPEQWRFNPGGILASHILGFVGYDSDELVGRYGIEQSYQDILAGKKENLEKRTSFASLFLDLGKEFLSGEVYNGHDLVLTVDPVVQGVLEGYLEELLNQWQAVSAGGIIMNPQTGAIIAMAGKPDFDPNYYYTLDDFSLFKNSLISNIFELGSVVKPLTLAAGLDSGLITPQTTYFDKGYSIIDGVRIENYDGKGRGKVNMQTVLNESLNTGAIFIMQQMGKQTFRDYMMNYGLAEKTGIDLPDEIGGSLSNLKSPREIEYATASFGQGIAVTPIGFVSAVSGLANGGVIMKPYLVDKIVVEAGKDRVTSPFVKKRVLKQETAEEITRMLVRVVDEALLGGTVKFDHYSVAAKTGTAQMPKEDSRGYYTDQYFHSFFGYAPAFDAKFLIFLFLERPEGVRYASYSLGPAFIDLTKFLLNYYEIPPDR